jgi:endonuclease YncB( thermonuclease family)
MERNVSSRLSLASALVFATAVLTGCQAPAAEPTTGPATTTAAGDRLTGRARVVDGDTLEVAASRCGCKGWRRRSAGRREVSRPRRRCAS